MGDGWQRPEASEKQVRSTTNLAWRKSKYLSLSHIPSCPLCSVPLSMPRLELASCMAWPWHVKQPLGER